MLAPANAAAWLFVLTLPICLWAAWSDVARMKIPNKAVVALTAVFLVAGFLVLPLQDYLWRLPHIVVVLVIGFALNMARMIGAGDAKFAAAMAPFVPLWDITAFFEIFAVMLLAAFVTHRLFRRIGFVRALTPNWASWTSKKFPMGLALGGALAFYLGLVAVNNAA